MAAGRTVVLGIETSCDETAVAVVVRTVEGSGRILSNVVLSQTDQHALYGGVVPEIAARSHIASLGHLTKQALAEAQIDVDELDAVAATAGPGLLGGLLVGLTFAKGIALATDRPLIAINHLEGHALTPRLLGSAPFPYLLLLVSGGHTQFQLVEGVGRYVRLGTTIDDALGEAFDKVAKLLGLGYPGGPQVEAHARSGDHNRFSFPRPLRGRDDCNFSFSGLKTSVRETVRGMQPLRSQDVCDICASFQAAIVDVVADRLTRALTQFRVLHPETARPLLVVAGGVAANSALREALHATSERMGFSLSIPPIHLCTDNAAMIAWAGCERLALGLTDTLDFSARARWPLDPVSAPVYGSGKLGTKV
jgi:N6-L-threonylcarbamoyladenine synthase